MPNNSKHFDAVIAKNNIARVLRDINVGHYEAVSDLPLRALIFDLREIEIYIGEMNQPSINDILETEEI